MPFQPTAAQRMQHVGIDIVPAIADDLCALQVEYIDAPVGMRGKQVGRDSQKLLGVPVRTFGNAATLADVPITVGALTHRHHHLIAACCLPHTL